MLIAIDRLPSEGLRVSRDFEFLSLDLVEENAVFLEPAHAEVLVRRLGDEVVVQGEVRTRLSFICSRCLTPFEFPVASRFDLVYLPEELNDVCEELDDERIDQMFYRDGELDLRAVVLEQLNLTFPAKPLCRSDCEGICAVCGEIIRDARCSCVARGVGARLAGVKIPLKDKS